MLPHAVIVPAFARRRPALAGGILLALLTLAAAAPLGAQESTPPPAATGTITGRVLDSGAGAPVAGATVLLMGTQRATQSGPDGAFRLAAPAGRHELRVTLIGYAMTTVPVTVEAGETVTADVRLERRVVSLSQVVATGTRRTDRTVTEAPVAIDVLTAEAIQQTGQTETAQAIQLLAPSVNFPRPSVADGTDHVRPATLRGLGPDQVLVLVNGKRRHTSALVNVNGTIGRGSTAVDLNAIPANAIERIEILRDGAAAQYGSDAIAGVINIVLKQSVGTDIAATFGQTREGDGAQLTGGVNHGIGGGEGRGFLHVMAEYRDREQTNRSNPDTRQQYFTGDPRNVGYSAINHRHGDGDAEDVAVFLNGARPLGRGIELYAFGGGGRRVGQAAGFWRRPLDNRTVRAIHPNGFLPLINSRIIDGSGVVGLRGEAAQWRWDLSSTYGFNTFRFRITNSNNASMGTASPTEFDAGLLGFGQLTTNLDLVRNFDVGLHAPLSVAVGGEFRRDGYWIEAGEPASYLDGGVPVLDGPNAGARTAPGAQVFPGFKPSEAVEANRHNTAAYVDLETNLARWLLMSAAGRVENYSDFGSTADGKVATRVELARGLALRGAAGTGFRAPSLNQQYFASTATNFVVVNGVNTPFEVRTFRTGSAEAEIFGARPLEPEHSRNLSAGLAFERIANLVLTADYYAIDIDDRIVFSGNFLDPAVRDTLEKYGIFGVTGVRYFTNAIDTRTRGVDIVARYGLQLPVGTLRATAGFNATRTRVAEVDSAPQKLRPFQSTLFDRVERGRIEEGQPRRTVTFAADYALQSLGVNVSTTRFGSVVSRATDVTGANDQKFNAKWITNASVAWTMPRGVRLTVGGNNIFDVYPDRNKDWKTKGPLSNNGIFLYPAISPFGFNGAFYFGKISFQP